MISGLDALIANRVANKLRDGVYVESAHDVRAMGGHVGYMLSPEQRLDSRTRCVCLAGISGSSLTSVVEQIRQLNSAQPIKAFPDQNVSDRLVRHL